MNIDVAGFTDYLLRSGLVAPRDVKNLVDDFRESNLYVSNDVEDLNLFCDFLVGNNVLTSYQCRMIRERKYKGFFLGEYVILDKAAKDGHSFRCLARHVHSRQLVTLLVQSPDLKFEVLPAPY